MHFTMAFARRINEKNGRKNFGRNTKKKLANTKEEPHHRGYYSRKMLSSLTHANKFVNAINKSPKKIRLCVSVCAFFWQRWRATIIQWILWHTNILWHVALLVLYHDSRWWMEIAWWGNFRKFHLLFATMLPMFQVHFVLSDCELGRIHTPTDVHQPTFSGLVKCHFHIWLMRSNVCECVCVFVGCTDQNL